MSGLGRSVARLLVKLEKQGKHRLIPQAFA